MNLKLKVIGIKQPDKLTAKGLEIAKCVLPTEGFGLHRNAMGTINVLQSVGASKVGDLVPCKGSIEETSFKTEDGEVKTAQWFIPE